MKPIPAVAILNKNPDYCPMCARSLHHGYRVFMAGAAQRCICGFIYQRATTKEIVTTAQEAGGDMDTSSYDARLAAVTGGQL